MKTNKKIKRRDLLNLASASTLLTFDPVQELLGMMLKGFIMDARAQTAGLDPRTYIAFNFNGGMPHWYTWLPLRPWGTSMPFTQNPYAATSFRNGSLVYETHQVVVDGKTYNLPKIWGTTLPRPDGSTVPMDQLWRNICVVRGVRRASDGHTTNAQRVYQPFDGALSLPGSIADYATAPIPALGVGSASNFYKSAKGISQIPTNLSNSTLTNLYSPFTPTTSERVLFDNRRNLASIDTAMSLLSQFALSNNEGADQISTNRQRARQLMMTAVGDLTTTWNSLVTKYENLINQSKGLSNGVSIIPGCTDEVVPSTGDFISANSNRIVVNPDLRSLISANSTVSNLARAFALAEYVSVNNLSRSVVMDITGSSLSNITYNYYAVVDGVIQTATVLYVAGDTVGFDQHGVGSRVSLVANLFHNRATAACLYELIQVLKGANLWTETILQVASEFNRSARRDETGSDHGIAGDSAFLMSGAISNKPIVMGDIFANYANNSYPGCWGAAASTGFEGAELKIGHVLSTTAALARVPSPTPNNSSLLSESGGVFTGVLGDAKNV